MARFRKPYPGWPIKPPYRPKPFPRAQTAWVQGVWDGPAGRVLSANTLYNTPLVLETASPSLYADEAFTGYRELRRLVGFYRRCLGTGSAASAFATFHAGLCVVEEDASGAYNTSQWDPHLNQDSAGRRWLWTQHWPLGYIGPGLTATIPTESYTSDTFPTMRLSKSIEAGSFVDWSFKLRMKPLQKLMLMEYMESTQNDPTMRSIVLLRPLYARPRQ